MNAQTIEVDRVVITPQPRNGRPFRFAEGTQGQRDGDWWNENLGWRHFRGPLLFHWQCPFGKDGEPQLIDGVWYWVKKQPANRVLEEDHDIPF